MPESWRRAQILLCSLVGCLLTTALHAQAPADVSSVEMHDAIRKAVRYLKEQQLADGKWPDRPTYDGGLTPLCTLALLHAGCEPDDPEVAAALSKLRLMQPSSTYSTALQTMVFCAAEPERDMLLIRRNVQWLESRQVKEGESNGMWAVPHAGSPDHVDNSMSHLALLALYEAERLGIPVREETWRMALGHWNRAQNRDGSWGWGPGHPGSGSMTCAGIAAVSIASGRFSAGDARVGGEQVECCLPQQPNPAIDKALAWLERNFSVQQNPGTPFWLSYYLYALERAGRLTAHRHIGEHDWYREGAPMLVDTQLPLGEWRSDLDFEYEHDDPIVSTAFSLMFLAKGRRPVLMAQLQHGQGDDWSRHRGALFNLTGYVERRWRRELTFQVIDIAKATTADLSQTPVLFLSGRDALTFTAEEKTRLREFVDRGGFIFAVQSCQNGEFDAAIRELLREVFPDPGAELHLLPPNHSIWRAEESVAPQLMPELWGVDLGCRTVAVYCPQDLACLWELAREGRESPYAQSVRDRIQAARSVGLNVLAYASGREVRYKDEVGFDGESDAPRAGDRGALRLANLIHQGGHEVAPAALPNLLRFAAAKSGMRVDTDRHDLSATDPQLFNYPVLFMHGRNDFRFDAEERQQLRAYLERGGTLIANSVCASAAFTTAFRREIAQILPGKELTLVAADDAIFTPQFGGFDITRVTLRRPQAGPDGSLQTERVERRPELEGIDLDGRYAVLFSTYDISCALASRGSLDCEGYTHDDAAKLGLNLILYAMQR